MDKTAINKNVINEIDSAGRLIISNMKINNADFETYEKIFEARSHSDQMFNEEEIAEAQRLVQEIEDAERERRYLYDTASKLTQVKMNATRCINDAETAIKDNNPNRLDAAHNLYVDAVHSYSELISLHKKAIAEARRDAFKARLSVLTTNIKKVGTGLQGIGNQIRRLTVSVQSLCKSLWFSEKNNVVNSQVTAEIASLPEVPETDEIEPETKVRITSGDLVGRIGIVECRATEAKFGRVFGEEPQGELPYEVWVLKSEDDQTDGEYFLLPRNEFETMPAASAPRL